MIIALANASAITAPTLEPDWLDISFNLDAILVGGNDIAPSGIAI